MSDKTIMEDDTSPNNNSSSSIVPESSNPLIIFSSRARIVEWNDLNCGSLMKDILANIQQLARVPKDLFIAELRYIKSKEMLTGLRSELVFKVIIKFK